MYFLFFIIYGRLFSGCSTCIEAIFFHLAPMIGPQSSICIYGKFWAPIWYAQISGLCVVQWRLRMSVHAGCPYCPVWNYGAHPIVPAPSGAIPCCHCWPAPLGYWRIQYFICRPPRWAYYYPYALAGAGDSPSFLHIRITSYYTGAGADKFLVLRVLTCLRHWSQLKQRVWIWIRNCRGVSLI